MAEESLPEKPKTAIERGFYDPACKNCGLWSLRRNVVPGNGPYPSDLMLIGEAPDEDDDGHGRAFSSWVGNQLNDILKTAGLGRDKIYVTHVVKCRPKSPVRKDKNRKPSKKEQDCCEKYLLAEIRDVQPKLIIAAGEVAAKFILGKDFENLRDSRGTIQYSKKYKAHVLSIYHPGKVMSSLHLVPVTVEDLKRASLFLKNGCSLPKAPTSYHFVDTSEKLDTFLKMLTNAPELSVDIETDSKDFQAAAVSCIGFSWKEQHAATIPLMNEDGTPFWPKAVRIGIEAAMRKILSDQTKLKYFHNANFDCKILERILGIQVNNIFDTMQAFHLLEEWAPLSLKNLAWRFTDCGGYEREFFAYLDLKFKTEDEYNFSTVPYKLMVPYNCGDADVTFRLGKIFSPMLDGTGTRKVYDKIVMPLERVMRCAEVEGVLIDRGEVTRCMTRYEGEIEKLKASVKDIIGADININSSQQLGDLFFKKLKLKSTKMTPTGRPKLDKDVLKGLSSEHEAPKILLDYREEIKLYSTYMESLLELLDRNDRIHTHYHLAGTTTGRLSSSQPNLQNIPKGTKDIKNFFVSDPGTTFIQFDFKQAEYRWWAHLANDPHMIEDIKGGLDIHRKMAALRYKITEAEVTDEQRGATKRIVFGMMYGLTEDGVAYKEEIADAEARFIFSSFFKRYPKAQSWLNDIKKFCIANGYVVSPFGRRRHLPEVLSPNRMVREEALRQATNAPIQSAAADMTDFAAVRVAATVDHKEAALRLNVHDSLMFSVVDAKVPYYANLIRAIMEQPMRDITGRLIEVPFKVDIMAGKRWGNLVEFTI